MSLDLVKVNFTHWRKTRKGVEPIPDYLWKQVYKLDPQYKRSEVCQVLGISGGQYKLNLHKRNSCSEFIEAKNPITDKIEALGKFQFKLTSGEKTVTMEITEAQIPIIFAALKGVL